MRNPIFNPYAKEAFYEDVPLLDNEFDALGDLKGNTFLPKSFY